MVSEGFENSLVLQVTCYETCFANFMLRETSQSVRQVMNTCDAEKLPQHDAEKLPQHGRLVRTLRKTVGRKRN